MPQFRRFFNTIPDCLAGPFTYKFFLGLCLLLAPNFFVNEAFGQYSKEPNINCESQCSVPKALDTLVVFPARIKIESIDLFGNPTFNWRVTGQTRDSLSIALSEYFSDSIIKDEDGVIGYKNTIGLTFPNFDSIQRKLIIDSIPSINYQVKKRKADTTMYVPEFYFWLLEKQHQRYGLITKIHGYVKDDKVVWGQLFLDLVIPVSAGYSYNAQTTINCYIIDREKRKIVYSAAFAKALPANYTIVLRHFLNAFFNEYLKKE